ncbi:mannosyl-oligosaccharide alpha-1,2-mannosidase IA-like [Macrobrachium rosenbergii]|uniref:mannosyl-oligosaccharide alpha-1,2-mannosidase IA-like n=1 Tax=Macrobrachium rosenbergii TaxID=79674 RepID=UPI0034D39D97
MTLHAWKGYKTYAWGRNELRPVSKQWQTAGLFGARDMGATLIDSLDTLFIMGLMEEFNEAKKWVEKELDFDRLRSEVSLFEVNIRFVGGLLSAYALTGEAIFRERALQIATKLLPAFSTRSGIRLASSTPEMGISVYSLSTHQKTNNHRWANGGSSILSEFGTLHLEFLYLSDVTGNPVFRDKVFQRSGSRHTSLGAFGDSFYSACQVHIQSARRTPRQRLCRRHTSHYRPPGLQDSLRADIAAGVGGCSDGSPGLLCPVQYRDPQISYSILTDFQNLSQKQQQTLLLPAGGMYALGAKYLPSPNSQREMEIAEGIAKTCRETYARTATGLGPDSFHFPQTKAGQEILPSARHYALRPEAIETWFYLWRLTKDQKYRDWAWDAAMALERHCRVESGGFSGISDVHRANPHKDDVQQSFLLAETLKYLYLIFSSDSLISLDQWVFNTEAHPIPILGKNALYRMA